MLKKYVNSLHYKALPPPPEEQLESPINNQDVYLNDKDFSTFTVEMYGDEYS